MNPRLLPLLALSTFACTGETAPAEVQVFSACEGREFTVTEPKEGSPWTPNAVTLVSEQLAEGVFAVYDSNAATHEPAGLALATSGGFVIGDDGVLLVETMINRQLLCQVYELVRAQTDKPVLYAINTSYHGDHSYGNTFLPESVQVVQHERTAAFVATHFADDVVFMESNFGADQGIDEAELVTPDIEVDDLGWSIDLGGVTVEAQYRGFAQTDGDLFVAVPEAGVLWAGNPLIAAEPAIPWLLDGHAHDVSETLAAVQASLPAGTIVVPGHGRPATPSAFSFSVDYLNTMIAEVQTSVDAGATLEATQAAVLMEDYQGYALWDWVHTWVNVPAAHAELSE